MESIHIQFLKNLADLLEPWIFEIAIAQISTLLVIYGEMMNQWLKKTLRQQTVFVRFGAFMLFNAFAIGLLTISSAKILGRLYMSFPSIYLAPILIATFILLGILAINRKQI